MATEAPTRAAEVAVASTKITIIYDNPQDPDAFEAAYPNQLALAKKSPASVLG